MKNLIIFLLLIFLFSSCQDMRTENTREIIYYPTQKEFLDNDFQYIDLKTFSSFDKLIDSLESLKYNLKKAGFKIESDSVDYHVLASTIFGQDSPPMIKFKNILSVSNDSVKKEETYPIRELKQHLRKDLYNNGRDLKFADSPEKLIVSVTSDIGELENLLIKILRTFQEIEEESSDSLQLNIQLNRRMEIFPPPPPLEN